MDLARLGDGPRSLRPVDRLGRQLPGNGSAGLSALLRAPPAAAAGRWDRGHAHRRRESNPPLATTLARRRRTQSLAAMAAAPAPLAGPALARRHRPGHG